MNFDNQSLPILTIYSGAKSRGDTTPKYNVSPNFQRNRIWRKKFKEELIISIVEGLPIGNIIMSKGDATNVVVDGQQRITTIIDYIDNRFEISTKLSLEKIRYYASNYLEKNRRILTEEEISVFNSFISKNRVYFTDFPELIKDEFKSYNLNVTFLHGLQDKQVAEYFRRIQNQEELRAGEIINSILYYNDKLLERLDEISDSENFCKKMGFKKNRFEFVNIFVNILGLLLDKLSLNQPKDNILVFAENYNGEINAMITRMILMINEIGNDRDYLHEHNCTVRRMQCVLLLFAFSNESDTTIKLIKIADLIDANYNELDSEKKIFERSKNLNTVTDVLGELRLKYEE